MKRISFLLMLLLIATAGGQCILDGIVFAPGATFSRGCRERCTCLEYGFYGCVSMCVNEYVKPLSCRSPVLVEFPNQCCKEWLCAGAVENFSTPKHPGSIDEKSDLGQDLSKKQ
ncbi:WNT1-inducible-signaling pathway protein 1-like [Anneissia japonica]|uniref:WNT1-inducible-signaling pathway protein 1-like n=1 Tax=Anneissia japonica TaxID=1529436 RepID=UPI0014256ECB|nr:WNT1-inducible-signaling pathway protein 1-like [Anneissia japonica]